ncbi:DUF1996 domain-containing protein [Aspergillus foveolatus]|uniref:DUF1996 domain-containing protein n=1 Tax=Aspergillus foveolatus TaxID=210207 RepID=UPI003CCD727B
MCIVKNGLSNEAKHLPRQSCEKLRSQVFFPSCWDGENLDSSDHKSHMAYPAFGDYNKGVCPESHPVAIFIFVEFVFNTAPFPDYHNLLYATGDRIEYGLHGDFINGWTDQTALSNAFETCTGKRWLQNPGCWITKTQTRPVAALSLNPEVPMLWTELGQNRTIPVLPGYPNMHISLTRTSMNPFIYMIVSHISHSRVEPQSAERMVSQNSSKFFVMGYCRRALN